MDKIQNSYSTPHNAQYHQQPGYVFIMFLALLLANSGSMAATFVDDFSLGLRTECWTVLQSTPEFYLVNATDGAVGLAKGSATTPGGVEAVGVRS